MCIIVHKPAKIILSNETLFNCFKSNHHGTGFMTPVDGKLLILKGFFDYDKFMEAYEPFKASNVVLHFRWISLGEESVENCHPFYITDNLGFAHNGTMGAIHEVGSKMSDTWHFNEKILKPLAKELPDFWHDKTMKFLLSTRVGDFNKLVFMDGNGKVSIYNAQKGIRQYGCWFSNDDFIRPFLRGKYAVNNNSWMNEAWRGNNNSTTMWKDGKEFKWNPQTRCWIEEKKNEQQESAEKQKGKKDASSEEKPNNNVSTQKDGSVCKGIMPKDGKVFLETPNGLVELTKSNNAEPSITIKPLDECNELFCDNCNCVIEREKLVETDLYKMCMSCFMKEVSSIYYNDAKAKDKYQEMKTAELCFV